jgi:hypothetical protein
LFEVIIYICLLTASAESSYFIGDPIEKPQLEHAQRLCFHNNPRSTRSPQNGLSNPQDSRQLAQATKETRLTRKQERKKEMIINKNTQGNPTPGAYEENSPLKWFAQRWA